MRARTQEDHLAYEALKRAAEVWEEELLAKGHENGLADGLIAAFQVRFGPLPTRTEDRIKGTRNESTLRDCFQFLSAENRKDAIAALRYRLKQA